MEIVIEGSPAFKANILPNDIIIEIDGVAVEDVSQAVALQTESHPTNGISTLKVLRNGIEKIIDVKINP